MTDDAWTVVGGKGRARKPKRNAHGSAPDVEDGATVADSQMAAPGIAQPAAAPLPGWPQNLPNIKTIKRRCSKATPQTDEERLQFLNCLVQQCVEDVAQSQAYANLGQAMQQGAQQCSSWHWEQAQDMIVYGLGSVEDSRVSRHQLAFAALLRQRLPAVQQAPMLYDPAFTPLDVRILGAMGMQLIAHDEGGARPVRRPTLFYLPHCEAPLCEALLVANWSPSHLPLLAILGNSFALYHDRWTTPGAKPTQNPGFRPEKLLALVEAGAVLELPVPDAGFHVPSAFNHMSLHLFPAEAVARLLGAAAM